MVITFTVDKGKEQAEITSNMTKRKRVMATDDLYSEKFLKEFAFHEQAAADGKTSPIQIERVCETSQLFLEFRGNHVWANVGLYNDIPNWTLPAKEFFEETYFAQLVEAHRKTVMKKATAKAA